MIYFVNCIVNQDFEHIGIRIKRLRSFKGMNQEDLAKAIGRTRSLISHLERTGNVNRYTLQEIAVALDMSVDELEQINMDPRSMIQNTYEPLVRTRPKKNSAEISDILELIQQHKEEIEFLRDTIQHQWRVIHDLTHEFPPKNIKLKK